MFALDGSYNACLLGLIRIFLATIFLTSALGKFIEHRNFVDVVLEYNVLTGNWARMFAFILPWLETSVGLFLIVGWQIKIFAVLSGILLLAFSFAIGINLIRGQNDLRCGCSGSLHHQKISRKLIARNLLLMLLSFQIALRGGGVLALDNFSLEIRMFLFQSIITRFVLPLIISGIGLYLIYRLIRQLDLLMQLVPSEKKS